MNLARTLLTLALLLGGTAVAQEKPKKERTETKHLIIHYDKFRDQTVVVTKPMNVFLSYGKQHYTCNMVVGYIIGKDQAPKLVMVVSPGGVGFLATFAESLDHEGSGRHGPVYFSPDADVIILVGDERYKLGRVNKDFGLYPNGDLKSSVEVELPLNVLQALAKAEKWSMAIGTLEAEVTKRLSEHMRPSFDELKSQYVKDTGQAQAKP